MGTAAAKSARRGVTRREAAAAKILYAARDRAKWPELARAAGLHPKNGTARRARDALLRTGDLVRHEDGVLALDAAYALPTGRELARPPNEAERKARTNFAKMDEVFTAERANLIRVYKGAQNEQIRDLVTQIEAANGDAAKLASLTATPVDADVVEPHLASAAQAGVEAAREEREEQIGAIAEPPLPPDQGTIDSYVRERAEAVVIVLAQGLSTAASKRAAAVSTKAPADAAADVRQYLQSLSDAELELQLGGAVMQSYNVGRREFMRAQEIPAALSAQADLLPPNSIRQVIYASELLDGATCQECALIDGTEYESIAEAEIDYPVGGYVYCEGGLRCRGTLVCVYSEAPVPKGEPPSRIGPRGQGEPIQKGGIPPIAERPKAKPASEPSVEDLIRKNVEQDPDFAATNAAAVERRGGRIVDDVSVDDMPGLRAKAGEPLFVQGPTKTAKSIRNKLQRKHYGTSGITDVNRGTVLVKDLAEIPGAFNAFRAEAEARGWKLADFEDRFTGESILGYRDVTVLMKKGDGSWMEVQFQINDIWAAKWSKQGHDLYDELKDFSNAIDDAKVAREAALESGDTATAIREDARIVKLRAEEKPIEVEMQAMYDKTWSAVDQSSLERYYTQPGQFLDMRFEGKLPREFVTGTEEATERIGRVLDWPASAPTGRQSGPDLRIGVRSVDPNTPQTWEAEYLATVGKISLNEQRLGFIADVNGVPLDVTSPGGVRATVTHEYGHRLDQRLAQIVNGSLELDYERLPLNLSRMIADMDDVPAYRKVLQERGLLAEAKAVKAGLFNLKAPWVDEMTRRIKAREMPLWDAPYLTSPEEIFARAFERYVAELTGDTEALAVIDLNREAQMLGFTAEDFAPMRPALEALFRKMGLLRD
jgi:hypothetical protein